MLTHLPHCLVARRRLAAVLCRLGVLASVALASGCGGRQSALDPRGPVAETIASVWWVMLAGATLIFVAVMAALLYAMFRRESRRIALPPLAFLIGGGLVFPTVVLTALLVYGTDVGRRITMAVDSPVVIEVVGHQWWWEVRYPGDKRGPEMSTANELRLPVGMPVLFRVRSADVIHSFWIPNLAGKVDMIPGRINTLRLRAGEAGLFRVQCSEFCGARHAHMNFDAIAEDQEQFDAWRRARAARADVAPGPGLDTFIERGCAQCHQVRGTAAAGNGGPELTHFGARMQQSADPEEDPAVALRTWLVDHGQAPKPGSRGPATHALAAADIEVVAAFLERLR